MKYPELETLVVDPTLYIKTVRAIGNSDDPTNAGLENVLSGPMRMSVLIMATTSRGRTLTDVEWLTIQNACDLADRLDEARRVVSLTIRMNLESVTKSVDIQLCQFADEHAGSQLVGYCWYNNSC